MGSTSSNDFVAIYIALFVIIIMGVVLKHVLRNQNETRRQIPLMVIAGVLLVLEIVKQVYHIICGDWHTWYIPLHFCSYFLVWYAVALFTRGKIRQTMYACSLTGGFIVSLLLLVAPRMILHSATVDIFANFNNFHTFFYHIGVMAYWIWMLLLKVYHYETAHLKRTIVFHIGFFFVTIIGAHVFQENFTNVLRADIAIMEDLRLSAGQFTYTMVLFLVGVGAISLVASAVHFIMKKLYHKNLNQDELTNNQ